MDIQNLYNNLWDDAMASFARGEVSPDAHLHALDSDERRGLSLIATVSPDLHPSMLALIDDLRNIAPGQFFYMAEQLHFTVMSLIPVRGQIDMAQVGVDLYQEKCAEVLSGADAFNVEFCGITASSSTVMIQGYPDAALNHLRDDLRKGLSFAGLGDKLDMRYRLIGAHVTLMRFTSEPENLPAMMDFLQQERTLQQDFGTMTLRDIAFYHNDYYMLPEKSEVLALLPLG